MRDTTIIVGANNAGKSTVVEALRLIAVATNRMIHGRSTFRKAPEWLDLPARETGLAPSIRGLAAGGHADSLFHLYSGPPAIVTATFTGGSKVTVYVGRDEQIFVTARHGNGSPIRSSASASSLGLTPVAVQPQVAPLLREEPIRTPETIRRGEGTYLASQHFRNQLLRNGREYRVFRRIAEETWPLLQIKELDADEMHPDQPIQLRVRDRDFVGEVNLMGHGLQMWLQIIWFLARSPADAAVVLDEPDVYMHPDLQRRLLNLVRERFSQLVIATHSIEIITDVDSRSILAVDRSHDASEFVDSYPGLQRVVERIGGLQNLQLARLMNAESFLLVEGEDVKLLRILQRVAEMKGPAIDLIPHGDMGGRGGWRRTDLADLLPTKNGKGEKIRSFAILDRDHFPPEEHLERYDEARQRRIELRIWARKEIENYLLVPAAICRFIEREGDGSSCSPGLVVQETDRIVESLRREYIEDPLATELLKRNRRWDLKKANQAAREAVNAQWADQQERWAIAPGKLVLSRLSGWAQEQFGASFGPEQIARTLMPAEVDPEVIEVIAATAGSRSLRKPFQMPRTS
jgi:energy-coupling factor transporter ATP-binding protein EcfA2